MASQEAAYWYVRCSDEREMPRADRELFLAWLKESPENVAEMLRIAGVNGRVHGQRLADVSDDIKESNVYDISTGEVVSQYDYNPSDSVPDKVKRKVRPAWALAAMFAVLALSVLLGFVVLEDRADGTVTTAASQWQHMTLEDGSTVHMDARTRLRIEFTTERRIVHLEDGQAVFEVVKIPNQPFTVRTEVVDVTAVGTRFGVAIDSAVTTTVSEGVVEVRPRNAQNHSKRFVHAGEEFRVPNDGGDRPGTASGSAANLDLTEVDVIKVDAERKLDWANGWLWFNGETIGEAVHQFNRRNHVQIVIDDRSIADRHLGVYRLRIDSTESFARLLDSQEGIAVIKDDSRNRLHLKTE